MVKVTPKENFMKLIGGGTPEYIPYYAMMGDEYRGESATKTIMVNIFPSTQFMDGGYDMWGVRHVAAPSGVGRAPCRQNVVHQQYIRAAQLCA
ncbi:MAG: hypothetical protein IKT22_01220, partial [Prevotella sp.]|nr:hypothetical protein [Prevotella sp.]